MLQKNEKSTHGSKDGTILIFGRCPISLKFVTVSTQFAFVGLVLFTKEVFFFVNEQKCQKIKGLKLFTFNLGEQNKCRSNATIEVLSVARTAADDVIERILCMEKICHISKNTFSVAVGCSVRLLGMYM